MKIKIVDHGWCGMQQQSQWEAQIFANNLEFPSFRKSGEYNNLGFQVIENNQRTGSRWVGGFLGKN
jgi:hypothetical protein